MDGPLRIRSAGKCSGSCRPRGPAGSRALAEAWEPALRSHRAPGTLTGRPCAECGQPWPCTMFLNTAEAPPGVPAGSEQHRPERVRRTHGRPLAGTGPAPTRVSTLSGHQLVRDGLAELLRHEGFEVAG